MKIGELLSNYTDDTHIKIGGESGNGYFYYGTVGDWRLNSDTYSETLRTRLDKRLETSSDNVRRIIKNFCKTIVSDTKNGTDISDEFLKRAENAIQRINQTINSKNNTQKWIKKFVPVNDRNVVEYYDADMAIEDYDCLIVIVEGAESGKFWDGTEADHKCGLGINTAAEGALMGMGVGLLK